MNASARRRVVSMEAARRRNSIETARRRAIQKKYSGIRLKGRVDALFKEKKY